MISGIKYKSSSGEGRVSRHTSAWWQAGFLHVGLDRLQDMGEITFVQICKGLHRGKVKTKPDMERSLPEPLSRIFTVPSACNLRRGK